MKKLPSIDNDFAQWYQEVVHGAELADNAPVRGMMIIRPYGYRMWELMKERLDHRIKATGHENASFPLLIPESYIKREKEHVEGFSPELAIVTYAGGKELAEPLVVRPTSETIVHSMFARWITSWRDLPLKINQWANVVRWEMRPRVFLRTTEFWWQEGHTAHATYDEAHEHVRLMLEEYRAFAEDYLAIPVITGKKTNHEKFPGAEITYTFEAIMQDGKALQMGTSHLLAQTFAHAFEMSYQDQTGAKAYPYLTSWGTTTRLIGAVIMMHGDQKGLILPPMIAPIQLVIIPILTSNEAENQKIMAKVHTVAAMLKMFRVHIDQGSDKSPGSKFYHWEFKGVPLRIEMGTRDLAHNSVVVVDRLNGAKKSVPIETITSYAADMLAWFHRELFDRAQQKIAQIIQQTDQTIETFGPLLEKNNIVYQVGWCGGLDCEKSTKEYKGSIRCILSSEMKAQQRCFSCQAPSNVEVLIAKSY
ncbi:MAG: proline--tRNA ligase [Candidatus Babeliales bacterium]